MIFLFQTGCIYLGKYKGYQAQADGLIPLKYSYSHPHGGDRVTRKSPTDALLFVHSTSDSAGFILRCEYSKTKVEWGGPLAPIFPLWIISAFVRSPNVETLSIFIYPFAGDQSLGIKPDSVLLLHNQQIIKPIKATFDNQKIPLNQFSEIKPDLDMDKFLSYFKNKANKPPEYYNIYYRNQRRRLNLVYPISHKKANPFQLRILGLKIGKDWVRLPEIKFQPIKQRYVGS
ncbi:MAG: hypothetical protein AAFU64_03695 [Bacteroidota bacterium]